MVSKGLNWLDLKIIPPIQVLILGFAMWFLHRHLDFGHWHPGYEYALSRGVLVVALLIFVLSIREFWKHKTTVNPVKIHQTSQLITSGIYSLSRNPIYLTDLFILLSWTIWLGYLPGLVVVFVFVRYITRFQIRPEEAALREKFGQQYIDYCAQTRRWI